MRLNRAGSALFALFLCDQLSSDGAVVATDSSFVLSGACVYSNAINDVYAPVNTTSDGRWYYKGQTRGMFIYFDSDCDGPDATGTGSSEQLLWIIDADEPSTTATSDLDGDGGCGQSGDGFAAVIFDDGMEPPSDSAWYVRCGNEWRQLDLTLAPVDAPTLSPTITMQPTVPSEPTSEPTVETCLDTCDGRSCDYWAQFPAHTCVSL